MSLRDEINQAAFDESVRIRRKALALTPRKYASGGPVRSVVVSERDEPELLAPANSRYYAGSWTLDRLIADLSVDIHEVVEEVERLCRREEGASKSYREHPELLYPSHPWMRFVASGGASYLGWESGEA